VKVGVHGSPSRLCRMVEVANATIQTPDSLTRNLVSCY